MNISAISAVLFIILLTQTDFYPGATFFLANSFQDLTLGVIPVLILWALACFNYFNKEEPIISKSNFKAARGLFVWSFIFFLISYGPQFIDHKTEKNFTVISVLSGSDIEEEVGNWFMPLTFSIDVKDDDTEDTYTWEVPSEMLDKLYPGVKVKKNVLQWRYELRNTTKDQPYYVITYDTDFWGMFGL